MSLAGIMRKLIEAEPSLFNMLNGVGNRQMAIKHLTCIVGMPAERPRISAHKLSGIQLESDHPHVSSCSAVVQGILPVLWAGRQFIVTITTYVSHI